MADINKVCSVSKCTTVIDERALFAGGMNYLHDQWVIAVRAGTTTQCEAHFQSGANAANYAAYIKAPRRRDTVERKGKD